MSKTKLEVAKKLAADRADEWSSNKYAKNRTSAEQKSWEDYIWAGKTPKGQISWYEAAYCAGGYDS